MKGCDGLPSNGLAFSGWLEWITIIDQDSVLAASRWQKRSDPAAPLERRVGLPVWNAIGRSLVRKPFRNRLERYLSVSLCGYS